MQEELRSLLTLQPLPTKLSQPSCDCLVLISLPTALRRRFLCFFEELIHILTSKFTHEKEGFFRSVHQSCASFAVCPRWYS